MHENQTASPDFNTTMNRIVRFAWEGLSRHRLLTIAAVTVMTVTLLSFLMVMVIRHIAGAALTEINRRVDIVVDVRDSATIQDISSLVRDLRELPPVVSVEYVSKDDALNQVMGTTPENMQEFLEKYDNPLSAKLHIITRDPSEHQKVLTHLKRPAYRDIVSPPTTTEDPTYQSSIQKLLHITAGVRTTGVLVSIVFIAVALIIIFNTIRITIHHRATEIEIMQLVGAHDRYIKTPLIIESILYGLLGTIISSLVFILFFLWFRGSLASYFGASVVESIPFGSLIFWQLALSIIICVASAFLATQKYLTREITW